MIQYKILLYLAAGATAIICAALAVYTARRREIPGAPEMTAVILAIMAYLAPYTLQYTSQNGSQALFWYNLAQVGGNLIAPNWLFFALSWARQDKPGSKPFNALLIILVMVIPFAGCLAAWTNPSHHLYAASITFESSGAGLPVLLMDRGPAYWVGNIYGILVTLAGVGIIVRATFQRLRLFMQQSIFIVGGALIPVFYSIATHVSLLTKIDLTPYTLLLSVAVWALGYFYYRALTVAPLGYKRVFQDSPVGLVILGEKGRVVDITPTAVEILGLQGDDLSGNRLSEKLLKRFSIPVDEITEDRSETITLEEDGKLRFLEVRIRTLRDQHNTQVGLFLAFHDISAHMNWEQTLQESERRLLLAQKMSGVGNWELDLVSKDIWASDEALRVYGIEHTGPLLPYAEIKQRPLPEERARLDAAMQALIAGKGGHDLEFQIRRQNDGAARTIHSVAQLVRDERGAPVKVSGVIQDITERKQAEAVLLKTTADLENFFNLSPDLLTISTLDGRFTRVSPSWETIFGYTVQELTQGSYLDFIHPDDLQPTREKMADLLYGKKVAGFTNRYRSKDGSYRWLEWCSQAAGDLVYGAARDITERKVLEEKLLYQSTHDALTGLFNRQYYEAEIERLQHSRRFPISILVMDMNGLKVINDTYGHHTGDEMLRCAAQALKIAFRQEDMIARIGGDEFVVVLPETDRESALHAVERLRLILHEQRVKCPRQIDLSMAIGFACGSQDSLLDLVFRQADEDMYRVKKIMRRTIA